MKYFILLVSVAGLTLFGCKKKESSAPEDGSSAATPGQKPAATQAGQAAPAQPAPPPQYVTAAAQNTPQEAVVGQVDPFLTQQLRIFVQQKRRLPNSFAEFAAVRLDSMPGPPPGKKWAIDNSTQEVKAVPAK